MEQILRTTAVFFFIWLVFRVSGKRTFSETTPFDFLILLIISECTQQALVGKDHSIMSAMLSVATFVALDILLSLAKLHWPAMDKVFDNVPVIIFENGRLHRDRMARERIDETEILAAAREQHGLERMDQIKYVVLEQSGGLSVMPKPKAR